MAIPVYLWLEDDAGRYIKGSVDIKNREGSIEVIEYMHSVEQPIDKLSGKTTSKRIYSSEFIFYRINYNGVEEAYFKTTLENAKVVQIEPVMFDIKHPQNAYNTHQEYIDLTYEKITWHYLDGNIIHSDTWKERG